jgi:sugar-phosphatase
MQEINCHAILFDMDGVLVDSTACVERHWHAWARLHGLDAERILAISHGKRAIDTMYLVASSLDLDFGQEALLFEQGQTRDLEGIVALPGALELVTALPSECWAIVTSATLAMATARLEAVGLPFPHTFITAEEVHQGKPHPEGYLKAASLLGAAPGDCLVIEDAPAGIQAARAGDIPVLAVTTTFPIEKLYEANSITSGLHNLSLTVTREQAQVLPRLTLRIGTTSAL